MKSNRLTNKTVTSLNEETDLKSINGFLLASVA